MPRTVYTELFFEGRVNAGTTQLFYPHQGDTNEVRFITVRKVDSYFFSVLGSFMIRYHDENDLVHFEPGEFRPTKQYYFEMRVVIPQGSAVLAIAQDDAWEISISGYHLTGLAPP